MLDSVTAESVFVEIMMDETSPKAFLLVEGTDENSIFFGHVAPEVVLIVCGGKTNVIGAAGLSDTNGFSNVYGLVDNDFDGIRGITTSSNPHIIATHGYDLVADLVHASPDMLRRSLSAHAATSVSKIEAVSGALIDEAVFALTSMVAAARLAAMREGYPLVFKNYGFGSVIRGIHVPADMAAFLSGAACRDRGFSIDETVIEAARAAHVEIGSDRLASGGHDIVGASIALLRSAGSQVSTKALSGTIISSATCDVLASLECLRKLIAVARAGSGVDLLDCMAA